jgi:hypothetical protein
MLSQLIGASAVSALGAAVLWLAGQGWTAWGRKASGPTAGRYRLFVFVGLGANWVPAGLVLAACVFAALYQELSGRKALASTILWTVAILGLGIALLNVANLVNIATARSYLPESEGRNFGKVAGHLVAIVLVAPTLWSACSHLVARRTHAFTSEREEYSIDDSYVR